MRDFDSIAARSDELPEAIGASRRGMAARFASSAMGAVAMSPWLGIEACFAWLAVVVAYELNIQFLLVPKILALHERRPDQAKIAHTIICAVGGIIYVCAPAYAWVVGGTVGLIFAVCWLAGTLIHGFHYYSHRRSALIAATGGPLLVMLTFPIILLGLTPAGLVVTMVMAQLIVVTVFGARDFERVRAERDEHDRARRAAEAASAAKSQFLAVMSHELRTPLNAVIGYAEILEEDSETGAARADDARRIQAAARHLLTLISDVLDMSKIEAGRMEIAPADTDIAALVNDVGETVRSIADSNGNQLTVLIEPGLGQAVVDPLKLRQCLLNLASNACKFCENGEVVIAARREIDALGARLVFTVSDTGVGIAPDQAERLFQPFSQLDATKKRRHGGTGLGLAITRELARLMSGDVELTPSQGRGAVFRLWTPALAAPAVAAPAAEPDTTGIATAA